MLKQLHDASGKPLADADGKPLMYESTADDSHEEPPPIDHPGEAPEER
jgi:hypothetical protein